MHEMYISCCLRCASQMCIRDSSYTFLVDGLKINDPANVYMIRDVASVTNVFIIGGDERIDLYKVNKV